MIDIITRPLAAGERYVFCTDGVTRMMPDEELGELVQRYDAPEAALRETLEETAWDVRLTAFVGAYQWKAPAQPDGSEGRHYLRFGFAAEPVREHAGRALDTGIERALWMTPAELSDARARHRSPLVWQLVEDYLGGRRQPLSALRKLA